MNHLKCELCPRPAMRDDILCFICSASFQEVIPWRERQAIDARKGQPIFDTPPERVPEILPTDNLYYRRWAEERKPLLSGSLGEVRR